MLDAAETLGPLTTLVNNAGVGVLSRGDILDVTPESYDRCMSVNARGMFFLTQAAAKRMVGRTSDAFRSIITITSANAEAVATPRAEYAASKAAAAMITKTFAVRLGAEGINVYDVRPGLIETDMTAPVIDDYKRRAKDGLTVIPRVGQPQEVAQIVTSLATGALPYTTGEIIHADGGMLLSRF
jgi:NAD(P)-dependent dehydrogenase (short-subunit alcohol dehydrogenase family)